MTRVGRVVTILSRMKYLRFAPTLLCAWILAGAPGFSLNLHAQAEPENAGRRGRGGRGGGGPGSTNETAGADAKKDGDKKDPKDELIETTNTVTINGVEIHYRATTGTIVMKDEEDKPHSKFFFIAYTRLDGNATNVSERPLTFSFNGGPGSSSVWLHMGLLGPRRVFLKDDGTLPPPPFHVVENEYSLLDESDIVFIDPVSTGYSRAVPFADARNFHGVEEDLDSVGDFIRLYLTRYERWSSPKFIIGESYGTTRAAGLSGHLEDRYGIYLNGIMLVSAVLNFETLSESPGNEIPYVLYLPTETATAWYHKKLPADLQGDLKKALAESEKFAQGEYSRALLLGDALPADEHKQVVKDLARFTGLSEDYVDRSNLRVSVSRFFKELLINERKTTGRYDSRITGRDRDSAGESPDYDPSYSAVLGPFAATFNDYVRRDLKFKSDLPYEILTGVGAWNYGSARNRYLNVSGTLRDAMTHNPYLKVFVANGYYDLATPYLATRYTFDHMELPAELRSNVSMGYYEAGHMMYINKPSLGDLHKDLIKFIQSALPAK